MYTQNKPTDQVQVTFVNLLTLKQLYEQGFYTDKEYINDVNNLLADWQTNVI